MNALAYAFGEAVSSLWRRRASTLLAMLTSGVALFVLGLFLLLSLNAQRLVERWTEAAELSVYLADDVTADQKAEVKRTLSAHGGVAASEWISSEDAQRRFGRMFPEFAQAASTLGGQTLPASFEVRLKPAADAPPIEPLVAALRRMPGVSDVRYDRQWVSRLQTIVRLVRTAGAGIAGLLVLAAALTVASVVRLALHARRQEIEIMHLVGAPLAYIRGPFVLEGVLQGGVGAVVAMVMLGALFGAARVRLDRAVAAMPGLAVATPSFLPGLWILALVGGGMLVGCVGGLLAVRSIAGADGDR